MKKFKFWFLPVAAVSLLLAGCVTEQPRRKVAMGIPHGKVKYSKVSPDGLELRVFGKTTVRAGRPAELTFALANHSSRTVRIAEWYSYEPDNILILVQPCLSGMIEPDPEKWIPLDFEFKRPVFHYPITLMPGNQVLVTKEAGFIEKLVISPGDERRFFVRAVLTLESLNLASNIFMLRVTSNYQDEKGAAAAPRR